MICLSRPLPGRFFDSDAQDESQDEADGERAHVRIGRQEGNLKKGHRNLRIWYVSVLPDGTCIV
jgi:hypothetical protein